MIITGQVLPTGSAQPLTTVPPGVNQITISNVSGETIYLGTSSSVSATNGFAIPNNAPPVTFTTWPASKGANLYIIGAASETAAVSFLISTAA